KAFSKSPSARAGAAMPASSATARARTALRCAARELRHVEIWSCMTSSPWPRPRRGPARSRGMRRARRSAHSLPTTAGAERRGKRRLRSRFAPRGQPHVRSDRYAGGRERPVEVSLRGTRCAWTACLLAALIGGPVRAEIYQWTDAEGRVHYTQQLDRVPPDQREAAMQSS